MAYLLDTNALVEPHRLGFALDVCPGYWDWLVQANARLEVASIDKVLDELRVRDDELLDWAEARGENFFRSIDAGTLNAVGRLMTWAIESGFSQDAVSRFATDADVFLVAYASVHGHVVVTRETPAPFPKPSNVKVPNACGELGVECIAPRVMLRRERVRFVLEQGASRNP